jgi:geranylgeranyl diphosphate synthase, type II
MAATGRTGSTAASCAPAASTGMCRWRGRGRRSSAAARHRGGDAFLARHDARSWRPRPRHRAGPAGPWLHRHAARSRPVAAGHGAVARRAARCARASRCWWSAIPPGDAPRGVPGGARIRPRLCLAVARACGDDAARRCPMPPPAPSSCCTAPRWCMTTCPASTMRRRAAAGRRCTRLRRAPGGAGRRCADRAGLPDLARAAPGAPERLAAADRRGRGVGVPFGIVAGQAWECEPRVSLADYQRPRPARCSPPPRSPARRGRRRRRAPGALGDRAGRGLPGGRRHPRRGRGPEALGKPVGRDAALGRPSAVAELGLGGAVARFDRLVRARSRPIPACPGQAPARLMLQEARAPAAEPSWRRR